MDAILAIGLGPQELIIIGLVILLLFGATKIPQLMRGMGQGISEFKKGIKEGNEEADKEKQAEQPSGEKKDS